MACIEFTKHRILVTRTEGDPKRFRGGTWGSADSQALHWLKKELNAKHGYDLIKTLMYKDGHLTDDTQHYLRFRDKKSAKKEYFWNGDYMLTSIADQWNSAGMMALHRETDAYKEVPRARKN